MKVHQYDAQVNDFVEVELPDEFSEEYRRRYELVQSKLADVHGKFSGVRLEGLLLAQIACRLTTECGFPVIVTICFGHESGRYNSIAAYPVPTP